MSSKVTKAQRRAQQAEFNRQLWAEAYDAQDLKPTLSLSLHPLTLCETICSEGPQETNYFLESRNVVPLRSEFKPPPILLSRKGPIVHKPKPPTAGLKGLSLESSDDDDDEETKPRELTLAERQAQAAKEREEKQRRYEERRLELFGPASNNSTQHHHHQNISGNSTPSSLTPPGSRSATPSRGRGGRGGGRARGGGGGPPTSSNMTSRTHSRGSGTQQRERERERELYDPAYVSRPPDSVGYIQNRRAENGNAGAMPSPSVQPIRAPRGPDASGRGGFGFANHPRLSHVGAPGHAPWE